MFIRIWNTYINPEEVSFVGEQIDLPFNSYFEVGIKNSPPIKIFCSDENKWGLSDARDNLIGFLEIK